GRACSARGRSHGLRPGGEHQPLRAGRRHRALLRRPMAVYVDNARIPFRHMKMCHMFADTKAELHQMAEAIGLRREWFQKGTVLWHYDVSLSKREEAIRRGAVPVDQ